MADPMLGNAEERHLDARPPTSDIARRRAARDLWVSRSHVGAAAACALAFSVLAFGGGMLLGKSWATPTASAPPSLTAEVPRDELLRLLARIDGNASTSTSALTFPDALRGVPGDGVHPGDLGPSTTRIAGGPPAIRGDTLPAGGGFTVVLASWGDDVPAREQQQKLLAAGIDARVAAELVEGVPRFRVVVGRHEDREKAVEAARWMSGFGDAVVVDALPSTPAAETAPADPAAEPPPDAHPADANRPDAQPSDVNRPDAPRPSPGG